jgi:hypothetical protein
LTLSPEITAVVITGIVTLGGIVISAFLTRGKRAEDVVWSGEERRMTGTCPLHSGVEKTLENIKELLDDSKDAQRQLRDEVIQLRETCAELSRQVAGFRS